MTRLQASCPAVAARNAPLVLPKASAWPVLHLLTTVPGSLTLIHYISVLKKNGRNKMTSQKALWSVNTQHHPTYPNVHSVVLLTQSHCCCRLAQVMPMTLTVRNAVACPRTSQQRRPVPLAHHFLSSTAPPLVMAPLVLCSSKSLLSYATHQNCHHLQATTSPLMIPPMHAWTQSA